MVVADCVRDYLLFNTDSAFPYLPQLALGKFRLRNGSGRGRLEHGVPDRRSQAVFRQRPGGSSRRPILLDELAGAGP